jgi:microcystin-dependent protein
MASIINAGTTTSTALNVITDTTGALAIQTSGVNAIAISSAQAVTLTNPLPAGSGGTGLSSLGTGVATFLGTPSSANLIAAVTDETGTGSLVFGTSPTISSANLTGTPVAPTAAAGTNTTQVATTAFVLTNGAPTGGLIMWGTGTAPSGWLLCNGAAVSTTTYAALFAVIGYTFGGAGASFSLPNYTNRMPYGTTVAATGGSADAVVVSHTHTATVTDPGHAHSGGATGALLPVNNVPYYNFNQQGNTGSQVTGISVSNSTEGVSGTNANLPPYLGINFIIKT